MKCCSMLGGFAVGAAVGAAAVMLLPNRRTATIRRQMRHAAQEMEDVMSEAMEGLRSMLEL